MTDAAKTVEDLRSRIEGYLREKKVGFEIRPDGSYKVRHGSTAVLIIPRPWAEKHLLVQLVSAVALNITQITPELTRFLAEENHNLLFGKFSLDPKNNAVWYEHSLLGDNLDPEELFSAIVTIVSTADQYDEKITGMAGGQRVADM